MPSNLYGVANAPGSPFVAITAGGANVNCPAGVETVVVQSAPMIAPSQGYFYCMVAGQLAIASGATPPTLLTVAARFSTGSDFSSFQIPSTWLTTNYGFIVPAIFSSINSYLNWLAPGSIIQVTLNPTAQAVTAIGAGTTIGFTLLRSPDQ